MEDPRPSGSQETCDDNVSVIIPCYNGKRYVAEAIESALSQGHAPHEVVVVDDGSTDDSADVIRRYEQVTYVRQENQGISGARNTGVTNSSGRFLVFLDADDRLLPGALETGVTCMREHPDSAFVFGLCAMIDADGNPLPSDVVQSKNYQEGACYALQLAARSLVPPGAALFSREAFEAAGRFDRKVGHAQDYELYLRISRRFPIHAHNQVVVEYRRHGANASRGSAQELRAVLAILAMQEPHVRGHRDLEAALALGRRRWERLFGRMIPFQVIRELLQGSFAGAFWALGTLLRHYPQGLLTAPFQAVGKIRRRLSVGRT